MSNTNFLYRARLNTYKRNTYLGWMPLVMVPILGGGLAFGTYGFAALLILALVALVTIMVAIDVDKNLLLFQDTEIVHLKNDTAEPVVYHYADIEQYHEEFPRKGQPYTMLGFKNGRKFYVDMDRAGGYDAYRNNLFIFLWQHNPDIKITVRDINHHYKYFLRDNGTVARADA